jgi:HlyD family secretion protein
MKCFLLPMVFATLWLISGCERQQSHGVQGYVEGEFVYVSSPLSGRVTSLVVQRGDHVEAGAALFALDDTAEKALQNQAAQQVRQAQATLDDAKKGKRPSEIDSLQAQLQQAVEAADFSEKQLARQEALVKSNAVAVESLEQARSKRMQNKLQVAQLEAELETARLGVRSDLILSAEAALRAAQAVLEKLDWDVQQKTIKAPQAGLVNDTLYHIGEWVIGGKPIISLLPPANIKVRTYIAEPRIAALQLGDAMQVRIDGIAEPLVGRLNFISAQAEYTPPVIYNRDNRAKLVFMVEIVFDPVTSAKLHPGQPVDVQFNQ